MDTQGKSKPITTLIWKPVFNVWKTRMQQAQPELHATAIVSHTPNGIHRASQLLSKVKNEQVLEQPIKITMKAPINLL
jgi:hypothetical protein